jgi:hypothetical protein
MTLTDNDPRQGNFVGVGNSALQPAIPSGTITDRHASFSSDPAPSAPHRCLSLSSLLMLIGVQFLTIGLLGELMERKNSSRISEQRYSIKKVWGTRRERRLRE